MILPDIKYEKGLELLLVDVNGHKRYVKVTSVRGDTAHVVTTSNAKYTIKLGSRRAANKEWSYHVYLNDAEREQERLAHTRYRAAYEALQQALRNSTAASTPNEVVEMMEALTKRLKDPG